MFRKKKTVYQTGNPYVIQSNFLEDRQTEILAVATSIANLAPNVSQDQRTTAIAQLSQIEQKIINFFIEFENLL